MSANVCKQKNYGHPCFDKESQHSVGRIHLPVAPKCNVKCKYCSRRHDCANESRPGVTSRLITPTQALSLVRETVLRDERIKVVGIAGPGDPLANQATFETLRLLKRDFPHLTKCLSTNGLLLPSKLDELLDAGLNHLTVTVNALNPGVGEKIYSWINVANEVIRGPEAAAKLTFNQLSGIERAVKSGLRVKVNSVLLPGINEAELPGLARVLKDLGVELMNIMPLIPQGEFSAAPPVPISLLNEVRNLCEQMIPQSRHCKQCRADAVGLLGERQTAKMVGCQPDINRLSVTAVN